MLCMFPLEICNISISTRRHLIWTEMASYARFCGCEEESMDYIKCHCGEDFASHEWLWEDTPNNNQVRLHKNLQDVHFHPGYSSGTAAVRGNIPLIPGRQYLWEIKMLSCVYGTDVMVGVGTAKVNLTEHGNEFVSLLGKDSESWGFSYRGDKTHAGVRENYGPPFGKGSIIGVHLDMWAGTLEFYLNRERLGVAFRVVRNQTLYPMVCSTVGNSAMRLVSSMSWPVSLQLKCLQSISSLPSLAEIPGLRAAWGDTFWWHRATELHKPSEEYPLTEKSIELEIASSDEEDQAKCYSQAQKRHNRRLLKKWNLIPAQSEKHAKTWQQEASMKQWVS